MCIHVPEWISNLLSFFNLVFADGFLRSTRIVRAILAIFIQARTTRKPCRFLTATQLKDFRILILENKILKKETLNTTWKSSLYFIRCEHCFHWWWLVLRHLERYPALYAALQEEIHMHSPPLDHPQTYFHLKYRNLRHICWLPWPPLLMTKFSRHVRGVCWCQFME